MSDDQIKQQDAPPADTQGATVAAADPAVNPNSAVEGTTTATDQAAPPAADQQQSEGLSAEIIAEAEAAANAAGEGEAEAKGETETQEREQETPEQYLRRTLTALREKRDEVKGTQLAFLEREINNRLVAARATIERGGAITKVNADLKFLRVLTFLLQDLVQEKADAMGFGLAFLVRAPWGIENGLRDAREYLQKDGDRELPLGVVVKKLKNLLHRSRTALQIARAKNKGLAAGALKVFDEVFDDLAPKAAESEPVSQPAPSASNDAPAAGSTPGAASTQTKPATNAVCLGCGEPLPAEYAASGYHRRCAPKSKPAGNGGKDKSEGKSGRRK